MTGASFVFFFFGTDLALTKGMLGFFSSVFYLLLYSTGPLSSAVQDDFCVNATKMGPDGPLIVEELVGPSNVIFDTQVAHVQIFRNVQAHLTIYSDRNPHLTASVNISPSEDEIQSNEKPPELLHNIQDRRQRKWLSELLNLDEIDAISLAAFARGTQRIWPSTNNAVINHLMATDPYYESLQAVFTKTIVEETLQSDFIRRGDRLVPKPEPQGWLLSEFREGRLANQLPVIKLRTDHALHRPQIISALRRADVGGGKGENDREIIADLFGAERMPGVRPRFVTNDRNILRGLLRLHLGSERAMQAALAQGTALPPTQSLSSLGVDDYFEYAISPQSPNRARFLVFKNILPSELVGVAEPIDLFFFTELSP